MTRKKTFRVVLHQQAQKELKKLPKRVKGKAIELIDALQHEPVPETATRIKGRVGTYRIRLGDYHMLYEVHATEIVVYVIAIGHRKEIYRILMKNRT